MSKTKKEESIHRSPQDIYQNQKATAKVWSHYIWLLYKAIIFLIIFQPDFSFSIPISPNTIESYSTKFNLTLTNQSHNLLDKRSLNYPDSYLLGYFRALKDIKYELNEMSAQTFNLKFYNDGYERGLQDKAEVEIEEINSNLTFTFPTETTEDKTEDTTMTPQLKPNIPTTTKLPTTQAEIEEATILHFRTSSFQPFLFPTESTTELDTFTWNYNLTEILVDQMYKPINNDSYMRGYFAAQKKQYLIPIQH